VNKLQETSQLRAETVVKKPKEIQPEVKLASIKPEVIKNEPKKRY
jgi:hypothetical protein